MWGFAPVLNRLGRDLGFTKVVLMGCMILYTFTLVADPAGLRMGGMMNFLSPSIESLFLFGSSGATPVLYFNRWWTVLTASWLHGGLIHIFFNMMWLRQLAPETAEAYGASRMIIIYTISGITGFTLSTFGGQLLRGGGFTVGASAPIFGLLAALVYYGNRGGSSLIGNQAKSYAVMMFVFGFIFPGVDNWAHAGGFIGGYGASKFLDPLKPERLDHLVAALVCLAATAVAILYSIISGLQFVR